MSIDDSASLPSPRAPLVWALAAWIPGYLVADAFAPADPFPFLAVAMVCAGASLWASHAGLPATVWGIAFPASAFFFAFAHYLDTEGRRTPADPWLGLPPREIIVEAEITRLFERRLADDSLLSGLAIIRKAPEVRPDLPGKRMRFLLDQPPGSPAPIRGTLIRAHGVLYPLETTLNDDPFTSYLRMANVSFALRRGSITGIVRPPNTYARFCQAGNRRLEQSLLAGSDTSDGDFPSIGIAMLLGKKSALPPDKKEKFILSGVMHLFAISGLHVGIVAALLALILRPLPGPKWLEALVGLLLLLLYVEVTGGSPSARRAFIMVACWWGARFVGRRPTPFPALVVSALIVLIAEPRQLWNMGFRLSYSVVAAIVLYGVPLAARLEETWRPWPYLTEEELSLRHRLGRGLIRWFASSLAISFAATLASTPLTVEAFGIFTPGAVPLNIFLVFLAFPAIAFGFFSICLGLIGLSSLGEMANEILWCIIVVMEGFVDLFSSVPGLFWRADATTGWAHGLFVLTFLATCATLCRRMASWPLAACFLPMLWPAFFVAFFSRLSFPN